MKRNKIISILEYSARNKMLVGILAVSLIGAGGVFLASHSALSNNTIGINKTVLAGTLNNDGNKACVINGNDSLVLYTSASNSNIQSYISVGEMLTINSYSNGYYNVTVQETGATGYIAASNMQKIVSGVGYNLTSLSGIAYTTNVSTAVNLREEATMNSTILAKLKNNTALTLLGKQGDWYKVDANGTTGYIYGEYIAIANSDTTTNSSSSSATTSKTTGTTSSNNSSSSSIKATSSKSGSSSSNNTNTTGTIKSVNGTTSNNGSSNGYTYGTNSELNSISGVYNFNNFTKGAKASDVQDLTGITINLNGIQLTNYITNSGNIYQSSARLRVYKVSSSKFTTLFGATPSSLGLQGSSFHIYAIGNVFIYQLPNQNIIFSYEGSAGSATNTSNNIATSNVSKWYGNYTVGNKVGQLNGYDSYGQSSTNITGQKLVIQSNEFQYDGKTIKNPQYYIIKVKISDLLGTSFSGADLSGANTIDVLAVLSQGENMSNYLYNALPSYTGCMSGAWAAGIAMPIILGPNGSVQVMNDNFDIYSTSQGAQISSTSTTGSNQGTSTQETTTKSSTTVVAPKTSTNSSTASSSKTTGTTK